MRTRFYLTVALGGVLAGSVWGGPVIVPDDMLKLGDTALPSLGAPDYVMPRVMFMDSAAGTEGAGEMKTTDGVWSLQGYSIGRTFSEQPKDCSIGDWCTLFPVDPQEIDWDRTFETVRNSEAYKNGYIAVFEKADGADHHLLFTRGGTVEIRFIQKNGRSAWKTYSVDGTVSGRPYRLYATRREEGNTAAYIDLTGKYVRFFGDPELITPKYSTPTTAGGHSNVVWGIDYDPQTSHALTARYIMRNEETHDYDCPQGTFVLAYYDTELKEKVVATIVVQIMPPTVTTIETTVGRELRPLGGGYDVNDLHAAINKGVAKDATDPYSPYLAAFTGGTNRQDGATSRIYGIAPTDVSTSKVGLDMPWKADVYWKCPDAMGTQWTFENDWYLIRWPENSVKVVYSGDTADPGLKWALPTNYVATVTDYREPLSLKVTCEAGSGAVQIGGTGRFVVQLAAQDGKQVWFLPSESIGRMDRRIRSDDVTWPVGVEVRPQVGVAAGAAAQAAAAVDPSLPGFIYEKYSRGRNWNPRLYHYAQGMSVGGTSVDAELGRVPSADGTSAEEDPYSALQSSIYGVNASESPIEVWWLGTYRDEDCALPYPVTYPCFVQPYVMDWTRTMEPGVLPQIVLASQRGSDDPSGAMTMFVGKSLGLAGAKAHASVSPSVTLASPTNRVGFQLYTAIDDASRTFAPGRVLTVAAPTGVRTLSLVTVTESNLVFRAEGAGLAAEETTVEYGSWRPFEMDLPESFAGQTVNVSLGEEGGSNAAVGIMLDDLSLVANPGQPNEDTLFLFDFVDGDLVPDARGELLATATTGRGTLKGNAECAAIDAGASRPYCGLFAVENGVTPELYYENDRSKIGYNPNEEHAFMDLNGEYVAWALRNDLNTDETSRPAVMVMYAQGGKARMQTFTVATLSDAYPEFGSSNLVGNVLLPPAPIGRMAGCQTALDSAVSAFSFDDNAVAYRDRKNGLWARRDGITFAKYGYPMREGFWFPSLAVQPAPGTPIAWLACAGVPQPDLAQITNGANAVSWKWTVTWPTAVPELKLGQVLTKATLGLPEMWNAASMAVCYPNPSVAGIVAGVESPATVVDLIDPTAVQVSEKKLPVNSSFPDEYGFILGPSGTTFLRKGKYYFNGLPPSVSDRFYVSVEAGEASMNLVGQYVEKESGGSYLELNVLTDAERAAIKALCTLDPAARAADVAAWNAAADSLAVTEIQPSPRTNIGAGGIPSEGRKEMQLVFPGKGDEKGLCQQWVDLMKNDDRELASRFVIEEAAFSNLGTSFKVVGGKPVEGRSDVLTAVWHETGRDTELVGPTRRKLATARYEELGLDTYLGKKWGDVGTESGACTVTFLKGYFTWEVTEHPSANTYLPRDHYALVANGNGSGYVTLIENDNPDPTQVSEGLPVKMHVIKVVPELYADGIAVLNDSLNKLSEKLTLLYRTPLGSAAKDFEFQWCYTTPMTDGTVPPKGRDPWKDKEVASGLVSVQLGLNGANLQDYVNTYYTLRYRPLKGTPAWALLAAAHPEWTSDEQFWSAWADEQLAEGWLQRVLNALTPFAQRVEDFYNQPSDIWYTMLEQIGRPYQGDVALNNDNLGNVGLLELYQTVFNRAESLLIAAGGNNVDMSKQLILAQTRMGEFYSLLGAEAYSDAKNPLVSAGADGQQFASGTFSFANQVPSLLDEELALLRGRTAATAFPRMTEAPLYNRLAWNLTKGISEGEPAYVANYGIRARDGILDVNCAAVQYPQGHGDAWGHYLSALTGYYRLLRNPYFNWTASMGEMLMDQKLMNVDYQDEQKFADAAVKLVQIGEDAMDLTLRKAYKEEGSGKSEEGRGVGDGYFDSNAEQAFGYGEWATRTGMAAAYNWMTANALLPTNDAPYQAFTDKGIMKITRTTATQLPVLASAVRGVERKLASVEAGSNPLGLSENAIPFDIDPDRLAQKESHFEQILERAEKALANCGTVLGYANAYGSRLAQIAKDEEAALADRATQEQVFNNQLIAIYGTPFSGDIGPGGTYPQGYDGPDLYNYTYMDLLPYGIVDSLQTQFTNTYKLVEADGYGWKYRHQRDWQDHEIEGQYVEYPIYFIVNEGGIRIKPMTVTGSRRTEGTIQTAYRSYLNAYLKVQEVLNNYTMKMEVLKATSQEVIKQRNRLIANTTSSLGMEVFKGIAFDTTNDDLGIDLNWLSFLLSDKDRENLLGSTPAISGTGMSITIDPRSIVSAASEALTSGKQSVTGNTLAFLYASRAVKKENAGLIDLLLAVRDMAFQFYDGVEAMKGQVESAAMDVNVAIASIQPAFGELSAAEAAYRAEVAKGEQLQEQRALWRQQVSNHATEQRYLDMYNRVQRNLALTKYTTAFDTAQRYVWELAKVYDFETGLLSSDPQSGKQFLADIIATRSLGAEGVSIDSATTDGGLYDVVNRLKANWEVLKPRLGINNPDKPAKWFSLRRELFRIKEGEDGDAAWKKELAKYRVDNILTDAEFVRHCQPPASANALVLREPGYVIPFSTSINNAENFFGKTLQFGDHQFSSSDYATKIDAVGVELVGLDRMAGGTDAEPNIYLVPVGGDYMRSPAGTDRQLLRWTVVDQVLPLPYVVGSDELDSATWISTFSGLDGTSDAVATIRRHSTMRAGADFKSTRLVGRSAWNDRWIIVIPASAFDADRDKAMNLIEAGVKDIKLGVRAYARQGN